MARSSWTAGSGAHERVYERLWRWEDVGDSRLSQPLEVALLQRKKPHRWLVAHALRLLLRLDQQAGERVSQRWMMDDADSPDCSPESISVAAAASLVRWHTRAGWSDVWQRLRSSSTWARALLLELFGSPLEESAGLLAKLSDEELGEFVVWLHCDFDIGELPDRTGRGVYTPSAAEMLHRFRESARLSLERRASETAVSALEAMCRRQPHNAFLRDRLLAVLDAAASSRRPSVSPEDLRRLEEDSKRVIVETPEQLLDVVTESLNRLEVRLQHSESPMREILWNRCPKSGKPTPKDETHLATVIKDHLDTDLVERGLVVNREVEILRRRQSPADEEGKRLDLLVQATRPGGSAEPPISIYIEVKLDTNRDWKEGLGTQLVDRYLSKYRCRHGLYLVGATRGIPIDKDDKYAQLKDRANSLMGEEAIDKVVRVHRIDCGLGTPRPSPNAGPEPRAKAAVRSRKKLRDL